MGGKENLLGYCARHALLLHVHSNCDLNCAAQCGQPIKRSMTRGWDRPGVVQ